MFVDLVGFTPLAEKRDPEHIRELLTEYFDRAQRIIDSYGGTVEKFIGDAVMAVWGAPTANEDDAERAVRAALEVVASVTELGSNSGLSDLRARGGVVTGEVAITIGKVAEGMVLGDTVNSASRVQSAAAPGTVLVDESTWRASSGAIAFEEVGALDLKGKTETVNAWRALRVVAQRKGLGRAQRLEPPFVGRDEEIRLIKDLLHATSREQRVRLVSVTGIPGIGKSRLSWEFLKYVDGLADVVYWHQGRSRTYGEGISFGALSEMVRMRAGILEVEDAATATTKLRACLEQFVPDADERQWIEPCLSHLLGLSEAPSSERVVEKLSDTRRHAVASRTHGSSPQLGSRTTQLHLTTPRTAFIDLDARVAQRLRGGTSGRGRRQGPRASGGRAPVCGRNDSHVGRSRRPGPA
jgi:class 3 adenylate cyclase